MHKFILLIKFLLFIVTPLLPVTAASQTLSPSAKISLLTCGPGEELYSTFGHTALRVCDTTQQFDIVFNYGTFDFNNPNFYMNFVRGKLNYMLNVVRFEHFMMEYMLDERWVAEQIFDFTPEQNQKVFDFLMTNSLPENRVYRYDFLFDNCTTRIRDLLNNLFPGEIQFPNKSLEKKPTFRNLLYIYLADMPWSKLGIDLLLGKRVDRIAVPYEYMFLPDYLLSAVNDTQFDERPLSGQEDYLYESEEHKAPKHFVFGPSFLFTLLLIVVVIMYMVKLPLKWFDISFFALTGLLGLLLVFMWIGTDHYVTKENLNLLWAFPSHVVVVFFLLKKQPSKWLFLYFTVTMFVSIALLLFWKILPQQLNEALIPIIALLGFRSYVLAKPLLHSLFNFSKKTPHGNRT